MSDLSYITIGDLVVWLPNDGQCLVIDQQESRLILSLEQLVELYDRLPDWIDQMQARQREATSR